MIQPQDLELLTELGRVRVHIDKVNAAVATCAALARDTRYASALGSIERLSIPTGPIELAMVAMLRVLNEEAVHEHLALIKPEDMAMRVRVLETCVDDLLTWALANRDSPHEFVRTFTYPAHKLPPEIEHAKAVLNSGARL